MKRNKTGVLDGTVVDFHTDAQLIANNEIAKKSRLGCNWTVECIGPDGNLKWRDIGPNLVVNEGLDDVLTTFFKGNIYTAEFYVGLMLSESATAIAAGDTAAQIGGSNGWNETGAYTETVRQTLTLGTVASQSVDNSASKASFSINASVSIFGAFLIRDTGESAGAETKSGTNGKLFGAKAFASVRVASSGDTLNVTVTLTSADAP